MTDTDAFEAMVTAILRAVPHDSGPAIVAEACFEAALRLLADELEPDALADKLERMARCARLGGRDE